MVTIPTIANPNQLTAEEHETLHSEPPALDYEGCERRIRDWIMEYEGYDLFKQILFGNGVTEREHAIMEGNVEPKDIEGGDPISELGEDRCDEIHILMQAAEDRAYLIVIIKLYQLAVDFAPQQAGHYRTNTTK